MATEPRSTYFFYAGDYELTFQCESWVSYMGEEAVLDQTGEASVNLSLKGGVRYTARGWPNENGCQIEVDELER